MAYRSPFHILFYFNESGQVDPKRLQQQVTAEFNLHGHHTLNIGGQEYTKDQALKTIELLKTPANLEVHRSVFENRDILQFLEEPSRSLNLQPIVDFFNTSKTLSSYSYVQDLFSEAVKEYLRYILKNHVYEKYSSLKPLAAFLKPAHLDALNHIVTAHLGELKIYLESCVEINKDYNMPDFIEGLAFLHQSGFLQFIDSLPVAFYSFRIEVYAGLCSFISCCYENKTVPRKFVLEVVNKLLQSKTIDNRIINFLNDYKRCLREELFIAGDLFSEKFAEAYHYPAAFNSSQTPYKSEQKNRTPEYETEYNTELGSSMFSTIGKILSSIKTIWIFLIFIVSLAVLTFLTWTSYPDLATQLLSATVCSSLVFFGVLLARER